MSLRYVVRISLDKAFVHDGNTEFIRKESLSRYESDPLDRKQAGVLFNSTTSLMREIERYLRERGLGEVIDAEGTNERGSV